MKRLVLLACVWPGLAFAQSMPGWPDGYRIPPTDGTTTATPHAGGWDQWFGSKQDLNGDISGQHFATPGAIQSPTISAAIARQMITPDDYIKSADAGDDALSIQRVIDGICSGALHSANLKFLSRHYRLNSPISQPCPVNWWGQGYIEQVGASYSGTWFDIGPAFIGKGASPVTLTAGAFGSMLQDFGVDEPGQTPRPVAITSDGGKITGWKPATWAPTNYPFVFDFKDVPGLRIRHVMLNGITNGFQSTRSGRTNFEDIEGQVFNIMITIDQAYDVSRIVDIHAWPFWSAADPVMRYQQANAVAILSYRNDTPFWDRIFALGVKAGIEVATGASGTTTGASVGTISCDFVAYCLWVNDTAAGSQATLQISNLRSYSQAWNTVQGAPVTMIPGSSALQFDGAAIVQLGNLENFGSGAATFQFTNQSNSSRVDYGSVYIHANNSSPNSMLAKFPTSGIQSLIVGSKPPALAGSVAGFKLTNTGPNGAGTGILQYPTPVVVH